MTQPKPPMGKYQCHKVVNACPMTRGAYNELRGWTVPENENPEDEGYLVEYLDSPNQVHPDYTHYISWSPKDIFEAGYILKPSHTQGSFFMRYLEDMAMEVARIRTDLQQKMLELQSKLCIDVTDEERAAVGELAMIYQALRNHHGAMGCALAQLSLVDSTIDPAYIPVFPLEKVPFDTIQALKDQLEYRYERVNNSNITACYAFLPNNFKIGYGESSCLNDADFDKALGEKFARERAEADAVNNLWFAEGYVRAMRFI